MATGKRTISFRLDDRAKRRVEKAARLLKQSSGAFLEKAGEGRARKLLLEWAVSRYQRGEASFSELTDETGLSVEEIMEAVGIQGKEEALQMFLASCHTVAEARCNPEFLRLGQEAVKAISSAEE